MSRGLQSITKGAAEAKSARRVMTQDRAAIPASDLTGELFRIHRSVARNLYCGKNPRQLRVIAMTCKSLASVLPAKHRHQVAKFLIDFRRSAYCLRNLLPHQFPVALA